MAHQIFISYASRDRDIAAFKALLKDLTTWRRPYWYDTALKGGLPWWEEILEQITHSGVFVPFLTEASVKSTACQRELEWAVNLDRHVLPIRFGDVSPKTLPPDLSKIEIIDYSARTSDPDAASECVSQLGIALSTLDQQPANPLPDPLPRAPEIPPSYAERLARYLRVPPGELTVGNQKQLVLEARELLNDDAEDQRELAALVAQLRSRDDITYDVRAALDELLERLETVMKHGRSSGVRFGADGDRWKLKRLNAPRVDLWKLAKHLAAWYEAQGMKADVAANPDGAYVVTCRSVARARAVGAGAKLTIVFSKSGDELTVALGGGGWKDKAASAGAAVTLTAMTGGGAMLLLAPSAIGSYRQAKLPTKTLKYIEESLPLCTRD